MFDQLFYMAFVLNMLFMCYDVWWVGINTFWQYKMFAIKLKSHFMWPFSPFGLVSEVILFMVEFSPRLSRMHVPILEPYPMSAKFPYGNIPLFTALDQNNDVNSNLRTASGRVCYREDILIGVAIALNLNTALLCHSVTKGFPL